MSTATEVPHGTSARVLWRRAIIGMGVGFILALLALLAGCGDDTRHNSLPPGSTVLVFGDSVTYGTGARSGEDFPSRLAELSDWRVINGGVPGDTTREALERLGDLLAQHAPALVIIELGGNDFLRKRREQEVRENLMALVTESQAAGAVTALVAVPRLSLLRAGTGTLQDAPLYQAVADATGAVLIPAVFSDVLSEAALRTDPVHPNAEGYRVLANGIAEGLRDVGLLTP